MSRDFAQKLSDAAGNEPIDLALRCLGSERILIITATHLRAVDARGNCTEWDLERVRSVRWIKSPASNNGLITFKATQERDDRSFEIRLSDVDRAVQSLSARMGSSRVLPEQGGLIQSSGSDAPKSFAQIARERRESGTRRARDEGSDASSGHPVTAGSQLSQRPRHTGDPEPTHNQVFNIHALGPSGSGKTVFMASLYHRMRLRRPEFAFYLKSDHESSVHLNAVYNRIVNPNDQWPEASRGINEWKFRACIQTPSGDYEPMEFRYLDYPGGILTNPRGSEDASIQQLVHRLRSANALLVLLDGVAIRALLERDPLGDRYMSFDITSSLEIAQQSRCPVHFVVTKWDILESNYTLDQVRDRLLANENFRDLVGAKLQDTPATLRLIPVSAVGSGFARQTAAGAMSKVGVDIRPFNVELPLLSVLPDSLLFASAEIAQRQRQLTEPRGSTLTDALVSPNVASKWEPMLTDLAQRASSKLRQAIISKYPLLAPILTEATFGAAVGYGSRLLSIRNARAHASRRESAAMIVETRRAVDSHQAALDILELQCSELVMQMEEDMPASVLGGGLMKAV